MSKLAWCVQNNKGDILVYTCQSSAEQCIDYAEDFFPAWEKMKELGCKIVPVRLERLYLYPDGNDEAAMEQLEKLYRPNGRVSPKRNISYEQVS